MSDRASSGPASPNSGGKGEAFGMKDADEAVYSFAGSARTTPRHAPLSPQTPEQYTFFSPISPSTVATGSLQLLASQAEAEGTAAAAETARDISAWHQQQAAWERQTRLHDEQQAELLSEQWRLVREQTGSVAQELGAIKEQLRELKADSRQAVAEVERFLQDSEAKLAEERAARQGLADSVELRVQGIARDLDAEAALRAAGLQELRPQILAAERQIDASAQAHRTLEQEVTRLGNVVGCSLQDIGELKDSLFFEASARQSQEESTTEMMRKFREQCRDDVQARVVQCEEQWRGHTKTVDMALFDRQQQCTSLNEKVAALEKRMLPRLEEVPELRTLLRQVESTLETQIRGRDKVSEQEIADRLSAQRSFETRTAKLMIAVEKEQSLRASQAEEYERLFEKFGSKLNGMVAEQAAVRQEMQSTLAEQAKSEAAIREAKHAIVLEHCTEHRSCLDARAERLDAALRGLEQRLRGARADQARQLEAMESRHAEAWARVLQQAEAKVAQEHGARELQGEALGEHVDVLSRLSQDMREVFLQGCPRPRRQG